MSENIGQKIVEKIRKMLLLAADQAGTNEGDTAATLARKLMLEHGIAEVSLEVGGTQADPNVKVAFDCGANLAWRFMLIGQVALHCDVYSTRMSGTTRITFWGRESGVEVATYLFTVLSRAIIAESDAHLAKMKRNGTWDECSESFKSAWRGRFCNSAVNALGHRLTAIRKAAAVVNATGNAIVMVRRNEAESWAREEIAGTGRTLRKASMSYHHNEAGYAAGQRIPIGTALGGASRAALA